MTGPPLRNIGSKYDSIIILNYITGDKSLIESIDYNSSCLDFPHLTKKEIFDLISYTDN